MKFSKNTCFISYSWDSQQHKQWVANLAKRLQRRGIIVKIDQLDNKGGHDALRYMESCIRNSYKVIVICTPDFARKAQNREGAAGYEGMIISSEIFRKSDSNKFIPVLRKGEENDAIPAFLSSRILIDFRKDKDMNQSFRDLLASIYDDSMNTPDGLPKKKLRISHRNNGGTVALKKFKTPHRITLAGYSLLGGAFGEDGIRYSWSYGNGKSAIIESIAFNTRAKIKTSTEDSNTSSYTTSVSSGCVLKQMGLACRFCRTGLRPYQGNLTPYEIVLQNVFMVVSDMACTSWPDVNTHKREFAYMGHGEPGFSYPQVRTAILNTDLIMDHLNQDVHRHIISTSGIPEMIEALCIDIKNKTFKSRVTLHFSLHAGDARSKVMPINQIYPYEYIIKVLSNFYDISGEKPSVGILLFNNFRPKNTDIVHTTDEKQLDSILKILDPKKHRISLCELNIISLIGKHDSLSHEKAHDLLDFVQSRGFEAKLFASFGAKEGAACGLLSGDPPSKKIGEGLTKHFNTALNVVDQYTKQYYGI